MAPIRRADLMKRAVLYLRVSTTDQTTANQERELREVSSRMGCEIVRVYKDHGISGAKSRDGWNAERPFQRKLCCDDTPERATGLCRISAHVRPSLATL